MSVSREGTPVLMPHQPRVRVSQVIPAPVEDVWDGARAFDSIDEWHPVIENCTIEDDGGSTEVGSVRNFDAGGRTVREELVAFSEQDRFYQYTMAGEGGNKADYLGEFRLEPITETGETLGIWFAHFDLVEGSMDEEVEHLENVFGGGLNGLLEDHL